MQLVDLTNVAFLEGYRVRLTFSDGTTKEIDLEPYLLWPDL